jgi:hypothetical protein
MAKEKGKAIEVKSAGTRHRLHPRRSCCKKAEHENGLITRTVPASSSLLEAQTAARRVFTRKRGTAGLTQSLQRWITRPAKEAIGLTEAAPPQRRGTTEAAFLLGLWGGGGALLRVAGACLKHLTPRPISRGKTNLALQFPGCPLD